MISAIVYQLTKGLTPEEIKAGGLDAYYVDHTLGIYTASAAGVPFTAAYFQSKGDVITDLHEDMAAEGAALQKQTLRNSNVSQRERPLCRVCVYPHKCSL